MRVDPSGAFRKLDRIAHTPTAPALEAASEVAERELDRVTPVDTGALRDSIGTRPLRRHRVRTGWGVARRQPIRKRVIVETRTKAVAQAFATAVRRMRERAEERFKQDVRERARRG